MLRLYCIAEETIQKMAEAGAVHIAK